MFKKSELIQLSRDRLMLVLLALFLVSSLTLLIMTMINIRVTDVQVPIRYSWYGPTNFYRDRWYGLLSFSLFGVTIFAVNSYIAIKLRPVHRGFALGFLCLSLFVALISVIVSALVFRLAGSSL